MLMSVFISEVRRALLRPPEAILGDEDILLEAWGVITHYRSRLRLTNEAWDIGRWDMDVPTTEGEMNITADRFGQAFLVHTIDSADPSHVRRTVDLVKF